ncbi:RiPP maturation radical SAM C-methyltransferase [Fusibacter ferrireducens]|uniref:RiPP maturation radical SAM C-methyltransferase n=1 Tax=Fusibacter ferrireducens TaxID=2785058 RepID=A0ABR9ZQA7_9FIRM|nr:RiPP maturation radical SAM C-methyltransferase [Fusibacter ferrireducens]MBF4692604.1 RiPP maturation radical SAM C-methyltransferase [Fusibacter ferrireducens]
MNYTVENPIFLDSAEVCLVCMPYCNPQIPSLALGLLQSTLVEGGIKAKSIYANLLFSEQIGLDLYDQSHHADPRVLIAEWSFASIAFPNFKPDEEQFIHKIHALIGKTEQMSMVELKLKLNHVRCEAEKFTVKLAEQILRMSPKIVGCSSSLSQRVPSLALLRKIHELNPETITLMGGADCEAIMGIATHEHFHWVDYVISGEGEDLMVQLTRQIFKHGREVSVADLPIGVIGPLHRQYGYSEIKSEKDFRALASSFHNQIEPTYEDYFKIFEALPEVSRRIRPTLPIQSSRGCWYGKCKFCGLNIPKIAYRIRPAEKILSELDHLSSRYGVNHFEFLDNVLDMKYFEDLIPELIKRGAPYRMFCEIRTSMSKQHFKMLREAGFIMCQPGIESLHSEALKMMQKGVTAWQNIQTLKWSCQYGIRSYWSILYDYPGDRDEWYREMAELVPALTHLYPPAGMGYVQYQRNSHYFDHSDQYVLKLKPSKVNTYIYPLTSDEQTALANTFEDDFYTLKREDPRMRKLFPRTGLEQLGFAVWKWLEAARSEQPPTLTMEVHSEKLIIRDTRPVAVKNIFQLEGIFKVIYMACENASKASEIRKLCLEHGACDDEIDVAFRFLLEHKLIISIDKRLLSLAIEIPSVPYSPKDQDPMGWIIKQDKKTGVRD